MPAGLPGTSEDNLRFASSRVRSFSSVVRGGLSVLSFPPGQMLSRKKFMNDIIRVSSRKDRTLSRILLHPQYEQVDLTCDMNYYLPFDRASENLLQYNHNGLAPKPVVFLVELEYGKHKITNRRRKCGCACLSF